MFSFLSLTGQLLFHFSAERDTGPTHAHSERKVWCTTSERLGLASSQTRKGVRQGWRWNVAAPQNYRLFHKCILAQCDGSFWHFIPLNNHSTEGDGGVGLSGHGSFRIKQHFLLLTSFIQMRLYVFLSQIYCQFFWKHLIILPENHSRI